MLSFLLFCAGLSELYSIAVYSSEEQISKRKDALEAILKDPDSSQEEKGRALRESGMLPAIWRGLFEIFVMLCAAMFAFKATFFTLLPIWLLGFLASYGPFNWKQYKALFIIDNVMCAALFFVAAIAVQ